MMVFKASRLRYAVRYGSFFLCFFLTSTIYSLVLTKSYTFSAIYRSFIEFLRIYILSNTSLTIIFIFAFFLAHIAKYFSTQFYIRLVEIDEEEVRFYLFNGKVEEIKYKEVKVLKKTDDLFKD